MLFRILAFAAIMFGGSGAYADTPIVVTTHEAPRGNGWRNGVLITDFVGPNKAVSTVSLKFSSEGIGRIKSFEVSTAHWKAEIGSYLNALAIAYPTRAVIVADVWGTDDIQRIIVELPYLSDNSPSHGDQRSPCKTIEVVVEAGHVLDVSKFDADRSRCWQ